MTTSEPCFPRGGTENVPKHTIFVDESENGHPKLPKSASALKQKLPFTAGIKKAKNVVRKQKTLSKNVKSKRKELLLDEKNESSTLLFTPERLSTNKITKGTMLLAAIKEIRDYELRVNLPNNVIGCVSVTSMCDAYTSLLKRFAQSSDDQYVAEFILSNLDIVYEEESELSDWGVVFHIRWELHSLDEVFTVGQTISCVCIGEAEEDKLVKLSINPKNIHEHLTPQCLLRDLVLYGAVSSIEDHGVHIDLGIPNITAFMPTSITADLYVGMVRRFRIVESDVIGLLSKASRAVSVALQTEEDKVERELTDADIQFNTLLPGMLFVGRIHARKAEGLVIQVGQLKGYTHVSHLSQHVKDYTGGEKAKFRVLAVNTATKYIHLTGLPALVKDIEKPPEGVVSIPLGEPLTVNIKRMADKYAFLTTDEGQASYMGISLLPEKMKDSIKKDTKLKCFWFGWDYLERRPVFSTIRPKVQKSIIPTLVAGDVVDAVLVRITPEGAKVSLSSGLHAFIQNMHLTEVPLKNPEKKLRVGQKLHCRILSVNLSTKRVRLTAKPSLFNSSLAVVSDLQSIKVGSLVQGVIVKITTGALISFYSNVVGFVSSAQLAKEPISQPADVFYIGQSVTCRVLSCNPQEDKLALSFILDDDGTVPSKRKSTTEDVGKAKRSKVQAIPSGTAMKAGQIIKGWTVVTKTKKVWEVKSEEGHRAILPHSQLSDMPGISDIMSQSIEAGSTLDYLVCITDNRQPYIVSNKLMFKYYAAKDSLANNWSNLKIGSVYPAFVQSKSVHGLFVSFGNGLIGLSPERLLSKEYAKNLLQGRSVLANVCSIDKTKERMIVSLSPHECSLPAEDTDLLQMMLAKNLVDVRRKPATGTSCKVSRYNVGDIVKGTILERDEDHMTLTIDDEITAEAAGEQTAGCNGRVGETVLAVVMHIDVINSKLTVLVDKGYARDMKNSKCRNVKKGSGDSAKVKVGQSIKSEVIYIRPEYILVLLRGHANGTLAYVPTLQHPNDSPSTDDVLYGQQNKAIIKLCENGLVIAALQTEQDRQAKKAEEIRSGKGLPSAGEVVDAVVTGKQELQLNLKVGDADGRVLLNEIDSSPQYGLNPLDKYQTDEKIAVKILGTMMVVSNKKLRAVKYSGEKKVMLDCSITQTDPEWQPSEELLVNKCYTCYVTKHDTTSYSRMVHVITEGGTAAVISWHQLAHRSQSAAGLLDMYPVGMCLYCNVVATGKDGVAYMQVMKPEGNKTEKETGVIYGLTASFSPLYGLIVNTPTDAAARIPLSEMAEAGQNIKPSLFKEGQLVHCRLVKKSHDGHAVMTLRKKAGLLELSQLEVGTELSSVVSLIHPKSATVMAAGHMVSLQLKAADLSEFKKRYKRGSACWIIITHNSKSEKDGRLEAVLKEPLVKTKQELKSTETKLGTKEGKTTVKTTSRSENKKVTSEVTSAGDDSGSTEIQSNVRDADTGVNIVFKHSHSNAHQKPALDFGASIKCLQEQTDGGNELDVKLHQLEEAGRVVKLEMPATDKVSVISARKVELAPLQVAGQSSSQAQTEAECLLLLKKSPNSGAIWSKFISFTAADKGVEAARARAEQALQTVSYRLEDEKLIVWTALLKLEIVYGTEDSLDNAKKRAMQQMDELKVYQELVKLYMAEGDNPQEAEQCHTMILRKWSHSPTVWISYGQFLYEQTKRDAARTLLQRCLKMLPTKQHIEVITKFAVMELKDGDFERFISLFENVISNFPKRTDVWSVYIDQLIKCERYDNARTVLRRAVMQKWTGRKIQFFISKFTDFETQHGSEESLKEANKLLESL